MVARLVRDQKAAGSNPATSTTEKRTPFTGARFLCSRGGIRKAQALERPWGKPPTTASGRDLVGGFLNRNERSVRWTVATIERTVSNLAEDRQWRGVLLDGHSLAGLIKCERECHWQGDSL